jgi:hypothetical protein
MTSLPSWGTREDRENGSYRQSDAPNKTRVAVDIESSISLPTTPSDEGQTISIVDQKPYVSNTFVTVASYTVPGANDFKLKSFIVSCDLVGTYQIEIDSVIVVLGTTNPGSTSKVVPIYPSILAASNSVVDFKFKVRTNASSGDIIFTALGSLI